MRVACKSFRASRVQVLERRLKKRASRQSAIRSWFLDLLLCSLINEVSERPWSAKGLGLRKVLKTQLRQSFNWWRGACKKLNLAGAIPIDLIHPMISADGHHVLGGCVTTSNNTDAHRRLGDGEFEVRDSATAMRQTKQRKTLRTRERWNSWGSW